MEIRRRLHDDLDACVELAETVHHLDGYPRFLPASLGDFLTPRDALGAWVAVVKAGVVGHVALHRRTSPQAEALAREATGRTATQIAFIARLFVSPQFRRGGIGRGLLEVAAQEAMARGQLPVLDVVTDHYSAIALYERCGWVRIGEVTARLADGNVLEEFVYTAPPPT
jgi:GNAT superfamily N-acetyltransferase